MKKNKHYSVLVIISLLATILVIGLLEISLRKFGSQYLRFNNVSQEYYTNPRGYHDVIRKEGEHSIYGLKYNEDSMGYRLPDRYDEGQIEKPQIHFVGLGDSFTYGRGVRYKDIYLTRLEKLLNQDAKKGEVKNYGIVGAGIQDIFNVYIRESTALPQGSIVIYGFVLNDFGLKCANPIKGLDFIDINNGGNKFNIFRKRSALVNIFFHAIEKRRINTTTIKAYLESFEGDNAEKGFDVLRKFTQTVLDDNNIPLVVLFPLLYDFENYRFSPIHKKIELYCKNNQILLLDLLPAFSQYKAEQLWVNYSDHHPNEIAHKIAADEIYRFVKNELDLRKD